MTELKLRLVASPAMDRKRRIASLFGRDMLTPPANVPTQSVPVGSRCSAQMELLLSPDGLFGSNLLCWKCRVAKSK